MPRVRRIMVERQPMRDNRADGGKRPVISIRTYADAEDPRPVDVTCCHEVEILDKDGEVAARFIYRPDKPLKSGAQVWVETENALRVVDKREVPYQLPDSEF